MKVDCTIKQILERRSGTNAQTGAKWFIQRLLVEWNEPYLYPDGGTRYVPCSQVVEITGLQAENFSLPVGTKIQVDLRLSTTEWNGKLLNNVRTSMVMLR